ncbi:MAG: hypothetical protein U0228_24765 [Myxococcaceae bacterium]
MQPSKWDLVLEQKPIPIQEHLLEEVSKLFAADLRAWPPKLDELDPQTGAHLAQLLAEAPLRPDPRLYVEAFVLARFDLGREVEAFDDHLRNHRWLATGLAAKDKPMLLFLARFLTEQLLALSEHTQGRLKRTHLLDVLARTERHFFASGTPS